MMGKMNIELPMPTQFDGQNPQLNEWAGDVKAYLTIHNVHIEDYMDERPTQQTTLQDLKDYDNDSQSYLQDEQQEFDEYNDMTLTIRRKRDEITSFPQTLNYVLAHSTKPCSEAHSMIKRIMRQSNGFEAWRQLTLHYAGGHRAQQFSLLCAVMSPSWDSTKELTKHYYRWLEDINRYEAENGTNTDHVQIATIINQRHQGANWTTLDAESPQYNDIGKAHASISNFFNSTYSGTDEEPSTIGGVNNDDDRQMIASNNWKKGKGCNNWTSWTKGWANGKGKDKGARKKGDYITKEQERTKERTTISLATLVERRATTHHNAGTNRLEPKDSHINPTAKDNNHRTFNHKTTMEKEKAHANHGSKDGTTTTTTNELERKVRHDHKSSTLLLTALTPGIMNQTPYNSKFAVQHNSCKQHFLGHDHNQLNHKWECSTTLVP
eukprot:5503222-Amphidinium_carterae.1